MLMYQKEVKKKKKKKKAALVYHNIVFIVFYRGADKSWLCTHFLLRDSKISISSNFKIEKSKKEPIAINMAQLSYKVL